MKVLDKIYVHVRTEPRPSITFSEVLEKNSTNEEYISKNALLKWAQEKLQERHAPQFRDAIGQLIDTLNKM